MPFQKGNTLARANKGMKHSKTQAWNNYGMRFMSAFTYKYNELLEELALGKKISGEEQQFMDRYEKQLEYFRPKLARTEVDAGSSKMVILLDLPLSQISRNIINNESTTTPRIENKGFDEEGTIVPIANGDSGTKS